MDVLAAGGSLAEAKELLAEAAAAVPRLLIDNNGDVVPPDLVDVIAPAGGIIRIDAWWVDQSGPRGVPGGCEAID